MTKQELYEKIKEYRKDKDKGAFQTIAILLKQEKLKTETGLDWDKISVKEFFTTENKRQIFKIIEQLKEAKKTSLQIADYLNKQDIKTAKNLRWNVNLVDDFVYKFKKKNKDINQNMLVTDNSQDTDVSKNMLVANNTQNIDVSKNMLVINNAQESDVSNEMLVIENKIKELELHKLEINKQIIELRAKLKLKQDYQGFKIRMTRKGFYEAYKRVKNKVINVYIGKDVNLARQKIEAKGFRIE